MKASIKLILFTLVFSTCVAGGAILIIFNSLLYTNHELAIGLLLRMAGGWLFCNIAVILSVYSVYGK